ncbi:hypothetical protein T11_17632 [Trichinella zimbabwensis]|uniref:Uncharacterized protein n=1 Tax=Trichinella zimbabwensis TaxID=268475 RepID=A0A0V1I2X1_9BILA|nr:hypothetical protein T11_17632 [Trichinella zimbabwensis]
MHNVKRNALDYLMTLVLSLPCSTAKVNTVLYNHNRLVVILTPTGRIELIDHITPTSVQSVVNWSLAPSEKFRLASKSSMPNRKHLKIIRRRCGPEQSKVTVRRLVINLAIIKIIYYLQNQREMGMVLNLERLKFPGSTLSSGMCTLFLNLTNNR